MLTSTALVLFMMPGLALFYGGLVGAKNVIATMLQSFVAIGVISLLWVIVGYSLTFGTNHWGIIGGLENSMLVGVGAKPNSYAPTIPALVYMAFQMKFAVITPALIAAALATALFLRRRHQLERPHNIPLVLLGAGILWFGWFGFNAGSALSAGSVAGFALVNTQLGASAAMLA